MKRLFTILGLLCLTFTLQAQSLSEFLNNKNSKTYWLGVDYSQVKLIGDGFEGLLDSSGEPVELRDKYAQDWNDLIIRESSKYAFDKALRKNEVINATAQTDQRNRTMNLKNVMVNAAQNLSESDIHKHVASINFDVKDGYGVMMIMESLDKDRAQAILHFVIIDLPTKKILKVEQFSGAPKGFGFRNFWARPIYDALQEINKKKYRQWSRG